MRFGNDYFRLILSDAYYEAYPKYLDQILSKPDARVRFAVLTDDKDVILGFSVARGTVLDYIYVQSEQRMMGIGRKLMPPDIETITHITKTGLTLWGTKYSKLKFNPFT